jgi:hypothetical protein
MTPPHVLSCYGIDWDDLQELHEGGVLPLERVLWLLDEEMRLAFSAVRSPVLPSSCSTGRQLQYAVSTSSTAIA